MQDGREEASLGHRSPVQEESVAAVHAQSPLVRYRQRHLLTVVGVDLNGVTAARGNSTRSTERPGGQTGWKTNKFKSSLPRVSKSTRRIEYRAVQQYSTVPGMVQYNTAQYGEGLGYGARNRVGLESTPSHG